MATSLVLEQPDTQAHARASWDHYMQTPWSRSDKTQELTLIFKHVITTALDRVGSQDICAVASRLTQQDLTFFQHEAGVVKRTYNRVQGCYSESFLLYINSMYGGRIDRDQLVVRVHVPSFVVFVQQLYASVFAAPEILQKKLGSMQLAEKALFFLEHIRLVFGRLMEKPDTIETVRQTAAQPASVTSTQSHSTQSHSTQSSIAPQPAFNAHDAPTMPVLNDDERSQQSSNSSAAKSPTPSVHVTPPDVTPTFLAQPIGCVQPDEPIELATPVGINADSVNLQPADTARPNEPELAQSPEPDAPENYASNLRPATPKSFHSDNGSTVTEAQLTQLMINAKEGAPYADTILPGDSVSQINGSVRLTETQLDNTAQDLTPNEHRIESWGNTVGSNPANPSIPLH